MEREVQGKNGVSCQDIEYVNSNDISQKERSFFDADAPLTLERVTNHLKHKPDYWKYESEWRLISLGKNQPAAIELGPSFLGAVFGPMHTYTTSTNDLRQPESKLFYTICQESIKLLKRTRYQLQQSGVITAEDD